MKFTGLTASLFTQQVDRSLAFYRDMFGFTVQATVPDQPPFVFVWLVRDNVNLFINEEAATRKEAPDAWWLTVGKSGVTMFMHVEGIDALWTSVRDRVRVVMPLVDQWYGLTEFSVADPDGYVVTFAERKEAPSTSA